MELPSSASCTMVVNDCSQLVVVLAPFDLAANVHQANRLWIVLIASEGPEQRI